jgi:GrpB-like predicted nucleotidyltransferase (UPF0157 family)
LGSVTVNVCSYSPSWPVLFEQEAAVLRSRLHPWLVGGVEHIGSTAVPGLAAKPILDMLAGIRDLDEARAAIPVLRQMGYRHADHRPHEALWFYKQPGEDYEQRTHQLHLTRVDSALWRQRLAFRNALRRDAALLREYESLKQDLSRRVALAEYTHGKRDFVARVLQAEGIEFD